VTQTGPVATEQWTRAKGLPAQTLGLAFSSTASNTGYAAAFVNKTTQDIYATTDTGGTWSHISTVTAPVADALTTDPTDPQDLVMLSYSVPMPGNYTVERSTDGGHTWNQQATTLPSNATVSQTGWADSNFLVAFQLDRQPLGDSALVAFPATGASQHLDVDGKIDGISIPHIQLITSFRQRLQIWGSDDTQTPNTIGLVTANMGKTWQSLSATAAGKAIKPMATTADGVALLALTVDQSQVALSRDGGLTWQMQKSLSNDKFQADHEAFVTGAGQLLLHVSTGANPGMYGMRNGAWVRLTTHDVVAVSTDSSGAIVRLWSYDANGIVTWMDA
jgi:hypothetical protein